jgi:hypothetical protein
VGFLSFLQQPALEVAPEALLWQGRQALEQLVVEAV